MQLIQYNKNLIESGPDLFYWVGDMPKDLSEKQLKEVQISAQNHDLIFINHDKLLRKEDLFSLRDGCADHLFPFIFHSRYIKLCKLHEKLKNVNNYYSLALFWLIEAGARHSSCGFLEYKSHTKTTLLPFEIMPFFNLLLFFFFIYSKKINKKFFRFPDRCSYKAIFWHINTKTIHKVYRYPWKQPDNFIDNKFLFNSDIKYSAQYIRHGYVKGPLSHDHFWVELERVEGQNCSDWVADKMNGKIEKKWLSHAFIDVWLTFMNFGYLPLDLSLSNAFIVNNEIKIIDLEETVNLEVFFCQTQNKRPLHCLFSIICFLETGFWSVQEKRNLRFDYFRDNIYIHSWKYSKDANVKWNFLKKPSNVFDEQFIENAESAMNTSDPIFLRKTLEKIHEHIIFAF